MSTRDPQFREQWLWRLNRWIDQRWLPILTVALVAAMLALALFLSIKGEGWVSIGAWSAFAGLTSFLLAGLLIKMIEWARHRSDNHRTF